MERAQTQVKVLLVKQWKENNLRKSIAGKIVEREQPTLSIADKTVEREQPT